MYKFCKKDSVTIVVEGCTKDIRCEINQLKSEDITVDKIQSIIHDLITQTIKSQIYYAVRDGYSHFFSVIMKNNITDISMEEITTTGDKFNVIHLPVVGVHWNIIVGNAYFSVLLGVKSNLAEYGYNLPQRNKIGTTTCHQ